MPKAPDLQPQLPQHYQWQVTYLPSEQARTLAVAARQ